MAAATDSDSCFGTVAVAGWLAAAIAVVADRRKSLVGIRYFEAVVSRRNSRFESCHSKAAVVGLHSAESVADSRLGLPESAAAIEPAVRPDSGRIGNLVEPRQTGPDR